MDITHFFQKAPLLKKYQYLSVVCLFYPFLALCQPAIEWDKSYGGIGWEELQTTCITQNGDYLLGGYSNSILGFDVSENTYGKGDFWLLKTDMNGNKLWDKRYGGNDEERMWKVIELNDGNLLLVGETSSPKSGLVSEDSWGGTDAWVIKTTANGTVIWDKRFGGNNKDVFYGACQTNDNGFILLGYTNSDIAPTKSQACFGGYDFWVVKIDTDGNYQWDKIYGGSKDDDAYFILPTPENNYLLGGGTVSDNDGNKTTNAFGVKDFWLVKIQSDGTKLWDKTYGGNDEEVMRYITPTLDGGYLLGGGSRSDSSGNKMSDNKGLMDFWAVKVDNDGNMLWEKDYGTSGMDQIHSVVQNNFGNFYLNGYSDSFFDGDKSQAPKGDYDFWLLYVDQLGNKKWDITYGGTNSDVPTEIHPLPQGGYLLAGHSQSSTSLDHTGLGHGFNDFWFFKTGCFDLESLQFDTLVCQNQAVSFNLVQPNCDECLYEWNDGVTNPARTIIADTPKTLNLTTKSSDGCTKNSIANIHINYPPQNAYFDIEGLFCFGDTDGSIYINDINGGLPPYKIAFQDNAYGEETYWSELEGGDYKFSFIDANGCILDTLVNVFEPDSFYIAFDSTSIIVDLGDSIQLIPNSNYTIHNYYWSDTTFHTLFPIVNILKSKEYSLRGTNENGCVADAFVKVLINHNHFFYVPTAFSPNGDGTNDFFAIYAGKDVKAIRNLKIFNRWGEMVYKNDALFLDGNSGWDGNIDGKRMPTGVYTYLFEIEYINLFKELIEGDVLLKR